MFDMKTTETVVMSTRQKSKQKTSQFSLAMHCKKRKLAKHPSESCAVVS